MEGNTVIQYDTLGLLSAWPEPEQADARALPSPPTPPSYAVFRSKITASVNEVPVIVAQDYYSLDCNGSGGGGEAAAAPLPAEEEEALRADPSLETAWFRPNARFKSPMVQLHKGA